MRVRDHGPGIPAEHAGRIFDRFFSHRPDQAGARQKHAGLGLSIARAIVERHGGALTGATHPGGGAIFELTLPAGLAQLPMLPALPELLPELLPMVCSACRKTRQKLLRAG